MKHVNVILILLVTAFFCSSCAKKNGRIIGMKIYEYNGDYNALVSKWAEMGINTSFISTSLAANDTFRQALKRNKISTFIIFPVFQNPEILNQDSSLYAITSKGAKAREDWVEFVCPSRKSYRNAKIAELSSLIRRLEPDGISIDFIRQFVFWEMIYPDRSPESIDKACYCDSCLAELSLQRGILIPDSCTTVTQKADYLARNHSDAWNSFRCDLISTMVRDLAEKAKQIKPELIINVHAVPWRDKDFGGANISVAAQNLRKISPYTNFISPMCYSQMLKRDAEWISDVVNDMDKRAPGMILPSIQVYPYYIDRSFTTENFRQCVKEALKSPSRGVVFFSWPLFQKDSARMDIAKQVIKLPAATE
jgi:hypothetical protein